LGLLSRGTEGQTGEGQGINMKDEAGLGFSILSVQQAMSHLIRIIVLLNLLRQKDIL